MTLTDLFQQALDTLRARREREMERMGVTAGWVLVPEEGPPRFSYAPGVPPEEALVRVKEARARDIAAIEELTRELRQTQVGDRQAQARIKSAIVAHQTALRRSRPLLQDLTERVGRRASHSLWVAGVTAVCGEEALTKVQEWMRAERARRKAEEGKS